MYRLEGKKNVAVGVSMLTGKIQGTFFSEIIEAKNDDEAVEKAREIHKSGKVVVEKLYNLEKRKRLDIESIYV